MQSLFTFLQTPIPNWMSLQLCLLFNQQLRIQSFGRRAIPYQGSHRLEKYLNLEGFLKKSLKNKSALKSTEKLLKSLE